MYMYRVYIYRRFKSKQVTKLKASNSYLACENNQPIISVNADSLAIKRGGGKDESKQPPNPIAYPKRQSELRCAVYHYLTIHFSCLVFQNNLSRRFNS